MDLYRKNLSTGQASDTKPVFHTDACQAFNMIDTAIIGLGTVAEWHRRAIERTPSATLRAVADLDADRVERVADDWGVAGYADGDDLLADRGGELDWVHVCTPVGSHASVATPFLRAGIHALVEKPVTDSREAFESLVEAAEAGGTRMTVVHNAVYYPPFVEARRAIESGRFGRLHGVSVRWLEANDPRKPDRGDWVLDLPGGEFAEGVVHPLYVGLRSAGYPADESAVSISRVDSTGDDAVAFDGVAVMYRTADGVTCTVQHHSGSKGSRQVEFFAEDGRVVADVPTQSVWYYPRGYGAKTELRSPMLNAVYWSARNTVRAAGAVARLRARRALATLQGETFTPHDTHTPVVRREARAIRGQGDGPTPSAEADWTNRIFTTIIGSE
jgi:predicted dehydrogenase